MNRLVEVKEFDSIICNKYYAAEDKYTCIAEKDFEDLVNFIREYVGTENSADATEFMRIGFRRCVGDVVSFKNYVGVIQVNNGFQVQVLPKIELSKEDDTGNKETKKLFLKMLRSMREFKKYKAFSDASLSLERMNLYDIFINMYIQEVRQLVKRGLRSAYVEQEGNLKYCKGKLLVGSHVKVNLVHKERFYSAFEEFHPNRPENRIVKATLVKLLKLTSSAKNAKELRQLLISFEMVECSTNYEKDFAKVVIDRNTKDYETLMKWSRVFLMNESFTPFSGSTTSRALLFPMESVYESYVTRELKKVFVPAGWDVSSQDKAYYLFDKPDRYFALRPDIVLRKGRRTVVLDAKWKRLFDDKDKNYGISQADMYQMYAYSKKYKTSEVWLLYPVNKEMRGHSPIFFNSGDNTYVRLHFVDVAKIEDNLDELRKLIEDISIEAYNYA